MATTVWATRSATVGTPSTRTPPPWGLGISTARTGGGKYDPELMRFQILNRLFFRSSSNSSRVWRSTPGAPSLAATRLYASHTSREQGLHSYYGLVRRRTPPRYSVPTVSASARSLSGPGGCTSPNERPTVSTLAFSRSVQEQQSTLTPPSRRVPPGQSAGVRQARPNGICRSPG